MSEVLELRQKLDLQDVRVMELEAQLCQERDTYRVNLQTQKANDQQMIDALYKQNNTFEAQVAQLQATVGLLAKALRECNKEANRGKPYAFGNIRDLVTAALANITQEPEVDHEPQA